jgi:transposase
MSGKRAKFGPEFKTQLVQAYLEQKNLKTLSQVARENGVGAETLRNWVKRHVAENPQTEPPLTVSERARLAELEREVRELKLEREFLGKAAAFFAKEYR